MLGWHISVYRQKNGGSTAAGHHSELGSRVAVWQSGWEGLNWIDELVKTGDAIDLGGNGYPFHYTAQAQHLVPQIESGAPYANRTWVYGVGDIVTDQWEGRTTIDAAAAECRSDEWLLVEAWDES